MKRIICLALIIIFLVISVRVDAAKVGYALSGGGARGFAHIGILKVLEENGVYPEYISGTSIGAVIGALYAMGYTATDIETILLAIDWNDVFQDNYQRKDLFIGQKRWAPYGNAVFDLNEKWQPQLPQYVFSGNKVNLQLFKMFAQSSQYRDFSELPIPFSCVSTDLVSGEMKVFDHGSLMQAVRASLSIPSLIKPFEIDGRYYLDGGITQNLPSNQVKQLGADTVIGFKVNSALRESDKIDNLIHVLDQTINIGMTQNLKSSIGSCDLIIEPELSDYYATSFKEIKQIIDAGELYAREHLQEIRAKCDSLGIKIDTSCRVPSTIDPLYTVRVNKISIHGNDKISFAKIREYTNIQIDKSYTINDIVHHCETAWNMQLFHYIYPELIPNDNGYELMIHVKERERKHLAINLTYTSESALVTGAMLSLHNLLMKNSIAQAEIKVGGMNELNLDLVKNFGDLWGIYYRMFPYINEKTLYNYKDHYKINSTGLLEYGVSTGIGLFAGRIANAEAYVFSYNTKLYRKISEIDSTDLQFIVNGLGFKVFHESLDDYTFPCTGSRFFAKLILAQNSDINDDMYGRFEQNIEYYHPINSKLSIKYRFDYGSFFLQENQAERDPFYIGGADGYMGYQKYEISAPFYKIYELGLVYNPKRDIFINLGVQGLNHANSDIWTPYQTLTTCAYAGIGIRTNLGPVKFTVAVNDEALANTYLNIGYSFDVFRYAKR